MNMVLFGPRAAMQKPTNIGGVVGAPRPSILFRTARKGVLTITCGMKRDDFYIRHDSGRMNKTAGKRLMADISKLARKLVELPEYRLPAILPLLEPGMVRSIEICRKMDTRNHGRNREENFLAKQLLHMDAEERQRVIEVMDPSRAPSTSKRPGKASKFPAENAAAALQQQALAQAEEEAEADDDCEEEEEEEEEEEGEAAAPSGPSRRERVTAAMPAGAEFLEAVDAGPEIERVALEWKDQLIAGNKETQKELLGLENLPELTGGMDRQMFRTLIQNAKKEEAEQRAWRAKQAEAAAQWAKSVEADQEETAGALEVMPGYADLLSSVRGNERQAEQEALRRTRYQRELLNKLKLVAAQAVLEAYQSIGANQ